MYHNFLILSSADGHLGCFHVLAIANSDALPGHSRTHPGTVSQERDSVPCYSLFEVGTHILSSDDKQFHFIPTF